MLPDEICTDSNYNTPLYISDKLLCVEKVDTPVKMQKGLSGREALDDGQGMLFIFPNKATHTFWMKDMNFDIDIIWIDGDSVVDITKHASKPPDGTSSSDLPIYSPNKPADKVLEVIAGFTDKNNIKINDRIK